MMKKVPVVRVIRPDLAALLPGMASETTIALTQIVETMREGLLAFTTAAGLAVFRSLLGRRSLLVSPMATLRTLRS